MITERVGRLSLARMRSTTGSAAKPRKAKIITPNGVNVCSKLMEERFSILIWSKNFIAIARIITMISVTPIFSPFLSEERPRYVIPVSKSQKANAKKSVCSVFEKKSCENDCPSPIR